ncbi:hypothetical protein O5282_26965 [Escherichia coli]|nr:hypothetical protein [Escherichia coli]
MNVLPVAMRGGARRAACLPGECAGETNWSGTESSGGALLVVPRSRFDKPVVSVPISSLELSTLRLVVFRQLNW